MITKLVSLLIILLFLSSIKSGLSWQCFQSQSFLYFRVCLTYFHVYILTCSIFNTTNSKFYAKLCVTSVSFLCCIHYLLFSVCYLLYTFDIHVYRDIKHNLKRNYGFVCSLLFFIKYLFL
jgi:hypothetical protein